MRALSVERPGLGRRRGIDLDVARHGEGGTADDLERLRSGTRELAGPYKREQILRQTLEPNRFLDDALGLHAWLVSLGQACREQLGIPLERREWVANLVREHR